jgi:hypothetical protein
MAVFSIELPDKRVLDIEADDEATALRGAQEWHHANPKAQSWGEWARGVGRSALQGATFDFADELGLTDREADKRFSEGNPIASTIGRIVGSAPLFVAGPGAAAARWAVSGGRMLPNIGRSATLGSGLGTVSGLGAGEGDLAERMPSAQMGGLIGLGLGAAIPPVAGAAGWAGRRVANTVAPLTHRAPREPQLPFNAWSEPIEGARFIGDGSPPTPPPGEIAGAQERALTMIRDTLLRSGRSTRDLDDMLTRLQEARTYHSSGTAQDATVLADLDQGLQRLAGSLARQSPEAAREITAVLQGRQTGLTPTGANARALAQRGIPTRERFADPLTAGIPSKPGEAERALGSAFGAGGGNVVPMGHRSRVLDALKRAFLLKDSDFHGHAANPGRTLDQVIDAAKAGAQRRYGALYRLGERVDLRPAIQPVMEKWGQIAASLPKEVGDEIVGALRLFYSPGGADAQLVRSIKNFDLYGKQYLDDKIAKLYRSGDNAIAGQLRAFRQELLDALDNAADTPTRRIATLYRGARAQYSDRMESREIIERFKEAWKGTEPPQSLLDDYARLSPEKQKLARLGMLWGVEERSGGTELARNVTGIFNTPRAQELLAGIIERSGSRGATFANRPERFGQYIDFERLMPETRNIATGGSSTARNIQDDLMQVALEASQNVETLMSVIRGNQSLHQLVFGVLEYGWNRAFGVGADAAREAVRMLFTANPAERAAVLQQVARIMPANRMAHFNTLMQQLQQSLAAPGIAGLSGATAAPTPQPGGGPVSL